MGMPSHIAVIRSSSHVSPRNLRTARPAAGPPDAPPAHNVVVSDDSSLAMSLKRQPSTRPCGRYRPVAHLIDVHGLSVGHVHAVVVEYLSRLEIPLGDGTDLHHRTRQRSGYRVAEQTRTGNGGGNLQIAEMIRDKEGIKRARRPSYTG